MASLAKLPASAEIDAIPIIMKTKIIEDNIQPRTIIVAGAKNLYLILKIKNREMFNAMSITIEILKEYISPLVKSLLKNLIQLVSFSGGVVSTAKHTKAMPEMNRMVM